jgi:hypothetical protein
MPLRTSALEDFVLTLLRVCIVAATFVVSTIAQAGAADMLALTGVARAYGFMYAAEGTQAAVELSRPGLSLLIRAGDPRYQVNDDVRYLNQAPVFRNNQIFVDAAFERVLSDLAARHPWPVPADPMVVSSVPADASAVPIVLTIGAKYVTGAETIDISGTGPPGFPVSVVLKARMSRDLPTVIVERTTAVVGSDGRYDAVITAASTNLQNTTFFATASGRGVQPVTAHIDVQKPNQGLHSPNDGLPKG